jgi:hypothetical protein
MSGKELVLGQFIADNVSLKFPDPVEWLVRSCYQELKRTPRLG